MARTAPRGGGAVRGILGVFGIRKVLITGISTIFAEYQRHHLLWPMMLLSSVYQPRQDAAELETPVNNRTDIVTLADYEATALRFIANAFEALEQETALGREQARLFSDRVMDLIKMHPRLNVHGGIVRERWLDLQKARYSFTLPTINVEIAKVEQ
jgi:hypothetical protein